MGARGIDPPDRTQVCGDALVPAHDARRSRVQHGPARVLQDPEPNHGRGVHAARGLSTRGGAAGAGSPAEGFLSPAVARRVARIVPAADEQGIHRHLRAGRGNAVAVQASAAGGRQGAERGAVHVAPRALQPARVHGQAGGGAVERSHHLARAPKRRGFGVAGASVRPGG